MDSVSMSSTIDDNDLNNIATTRKLTAAYGEALSVSKEAIATLSTPPNMPSILLLPPEVRTMIWKHVFRGEVVNVCSRPRNYYQYNDIFYLKSVPYLQANYSPHPLYYTNQLVRSEVTDMLWRLAIFSVSHLNLRLMLPVALSSRVRKLELDWPQYKASLDDIQYPFLNELNEPEAPQYIQVTGYDSLEHLKLIYDVDGSADGIDVSGVFGQSFVRLVYFTKPFLLELTIPVHDKRINAYMCATYFSDSGLRFEHCGRAVCKEWEEDIQMALELVPADVEEWLQADLEDGYLVGREDYNKVKKYITSERLPALERLGNNMSGCIPDGFLHEL